MGLRNGISIGRRKKHIRIGNKFDCVEGVSLGKWSKNWSCYRRYTQQTNKQTNKHTHTHINQHTLAGLLVHLQRQYKPTGLPARSQDSTGLPVHLQGCALTQHEPQIKMPPTTSLPHPWFEAHGGGCLYAHLIGPEQGQMSSNFFKISSKILPSKINCVLKKWFLNFDEMKYIQKILHITVVV